MQRHTKVAISILAAASMMMSLVGCGGKFQLSIGHRLNIERRFNIEHGFSICRF